MNPRTLIDRLNSTPIFYKILIANVAIVLLGAFGGTYVTINTIHRFGDDSHTLLLTAFVAVGIILSISVNFLVLRAAFRPLESLERLSDAVRAGNLSARAKPEARSDPQLTRLAETFNGTLDELEQDRVKLRELANQVVSAQEDERRRLARELHDDTAQLLFAQLLSVTALKASAHDDVRETAERLERMTVDAIEGVRRLALELRPPALDDLGLREALADLVQRFENQLGFPVQLRWQGSRDRLSPETELVLYRVAQEAVTNSAKHADASEISVKVLRTEDMVRLTVDDNGRGFDPKAPFRNEESGLGLGLFGMEERVTLVGGSLDIIGRSPSGTRVFAQIPLNSSIPQDSRARKEAGRVD